MCVHICICTLSYMYTSVTGFFAFNLEREKNPTLDYFVLEKSLRDLFDSGLLYVIWRNDDAHSIRECMIKQLKWRKWWWHHLPTAICITTRCSDYRIFRCQNVFISFSAWMIYAKNSNTTVNSFPTYLCRLWIKSTMVLKGHDLYQVPIEKTLHKQCVHLSATNTHSSVAPVCTCLANSFAKSQPQFLKIINRASANSSQNKSDGLMFWMLKLVQLQTLRHN